MSIYHEYVLSHSFYYLVINMVIMPQFALSFGSKGIRVCILICQLPSTSF